MRVIHVGEEGRWSRKESIELQFHQFSRIDKGVGEYVTSSVFDCHGVQWKLRLYPRGDKSTRKSDNEQRVGAYLIVDSRSFDKGQEYTARYSVAVPKLGIAKKGSSFTFRKTERSWGWPELAWRKDVLSSGCDEDTLSIVVTIQVYNNRRRSWKPQAVLQKSMLKHFLREVNADMTFEVGQGDALQRIRVNRALLYLQAPTIKDAIDGMAGVSHVPSTHGDGDSNSDSNSNSNSDDSHSIVGDEGNPCNSTNGDDDNGNDEKNDADASVETTSLVGGSSHARTSGDGENDSMSATRSFILEAGSSHTGSKSSLSISKSNHSIGKSDYSVGKSNHSISKSNHSVGKSDHSISKSNHSISRSSRSNGIRTKRRSNHSSSAKGGYSSDVVVIPDVSPRYFRHVLQFIFSHDTRFLSDYSTRSDLMELLSVANRFGCWKLKLIIEAKLIDNYLDDESIIDLLQFAASQNCSMLMEAALETIGKEPSLLVRHPRFSAISRSEDLMAAAQQYATGKRPNDGLDDEYAKMTVGELYEMLDSDDEALLDTDLSRVDLLRMARNLFGKARYTAS